MNMFGKCRAWIFGATILIGSMVIPTAQADEAFGDPIPDDAVYLGTDMGGEFVTLERQDITLENGKVLPAFHMEIYGAFSTGKPYGIDREGMLVYSGLGLYVPPEIMLRQSPWQTYAPPSIDYILGQQEGENNAGVNSDILWISMKPRSEDPNRDYVGMIMPLNLP